MTLSKEWIAKEAHKYIDGRSLENSERPQACQGERTPVSLGLEPWKIVFFLCGFCRVRTRLNEQVFPFSAALASANDPHMLDNIKVHLIERKNLALGKEERWAWNLATAHSFLLPGPTLERAHESASHLEALFRPTSTALLA